MLKNYTEIKTYKNGDKHYVNDKGQPHRLDGPAIENSYRTKFWFMNGNPHRNIDPAIEWVDGNKQWFFKYELHRIGGSFALDKKWWYIHGKEYIKQQYFNEVWDI